MIPITNILVILFLALMVYWWGAVQGLFSAFLHLMVTVIAGALALALWEPLVLGFLIERMPAYAWGIGLLGPFVLLLIGLRTAMDKFVPGNVIFPSLVNWTAGGLCGLFAGILTAGLTLIGLGFLPLPANLAGYQPLAVGLDGSTTVNAKGGLYVAVDRQAAGFFSGLSRGAFASSTPLAVHQPELHTQAALFRMRYDKHHSVGIVPSSVTVSDWYASGLPVNELPTPVTQSLGEDAVNPEMQIVVVDTTFTLQLGTYDPDSVLRIPPTQVRLVVQQQGSPWAPARLIEPKAVSIVEPRGDERRYLPFDSDSVFVTSTYQEQVFGWVFVAEADEVPRFILIRHLRLELPADHTITREALVQAVGRPQAAASEQVQGPTTEPGVEYPLGERQGKVTGSIGQSIGIFDTLPSPISRNRAGGFRFEGDAIVEGNGDVQPWSEHPPRQLIVNRVYAHPHQVMVRLELQPDQAQSMFGKAFASAAMLSNIRLEDSLGQTWWPTGYAWKQANGTQQIRFGITPIQSARELPITRMGPNDTLYLYFPVTRSQPGTPNRIVRLHIASTTQDVSLDIPE